ncbi:ATP-binding cassette domain-containing protein [Butyrivibrio sp. XPD2006]|uniref:ATP-binding cassette domain-containing protein n=1 Tax=Butyrivibrio sp. XPD2006 TaxID=1280668 RepID=UPI0003B51320|nr:ATP-binding cassette domain-containing protein [Butyrivibrio sp. XPD2006]
MKLDKVVAGYHKKIVVRDVDLCLAPGEIIGIIGPNGGGKSTILKSINGSLSLIGGSVLLDDLDVSKALPKEISKVMSVVTTERVKPILMTCRDVVAAGRIPFTDGFGRLREEDNAQIDRAMELMKIKELSDVSYSDVSDGQKQRTLIARAIAQNPKYLVMDEPTSYMDIRHRYELMETLKKLSGEGVTIVASLHELELALSYCDRLLLVYDDGHVLVKTPKEVLSEDLLKELFDLRDDMYEKVLRSVMGEKREGGTSFFINRACKSFPCHDVPEDEFNCMFCYCPLYDMKDCGGDYTYNDKGIKNCKNCSFPHFKDNYPVVIKKLKEKMYGSGIKE